MPGSLILVNPKASRVDGLLDPIGEASFSARIRPAALQVLQPTS